MDEPTMTTQERQLCDFLRDLPRHHKYRYNPAASRALLYNLFWSLAGGQEQYMRLLFPEGHRPSVSGTWKLKEAQGAGEGAEYTEAARGKACGHIFKVAEATYRCKTCSDDFTCVLCSRCYEASDHEGHVVTIHISQGNGGCCDCGDPEAWKLPVQCSIHTADEAHSKRAGKAKQAAPLPDDLIESMRMTIARAFDYIIDVISCSPEQLRLPKDKDSILADERSSRLKSAYYSGDVAEEPTEFALLLWNDEKHTVTDVQSQIARACRTTLAEGLKRSHETDDVGRSVLKYDTDIDKLLAVSKVIEHIKVTVTIRSARDTFREQMCETIVDWLGDIAGCSVGEDHDILRQIVCEEMLKEWRTGSTASNAVVGKNGIDDHELDDQVEEGLMFLRQQAEFLAAVEAARRNGDGANDMDVEEDDDDDDEEEELGDQSDDGSDFGADAMIVDFVPTRAGAADPDGDVDMDDSALEMQEATLAGYPPPPPPPPAPARVLRDRELTPSDSDTAEPLIPPSIYTKTGGQIPKTPNKRVVTKSSYKPATYWLTTPAAFHERDSIALYEDFWRRVRLDWLILFDLRLWKRVRINLRDLYVSTVVTIPQFKRILGLRFAGLYTTLAQLYLIADREPDHAIIHISVQMLTTPSVTAEIVERGNFLTNLMAILYTFLSTRQVGHPHEVYPEAVLAIDSGSVTNRRTEHFFTDLRYLFCSEYVQERLRTEPRYMMQFLDLLKLHQGICPNIRAVGEHVEYETDAWIMASQLTRHVHCLCRQFGESFKWKRGEDPEYVTHAIRLAAKAAILNSLGTERKRFSTSEIKDDIKFHTIDDFEFEGTDNIPPRHKVVHFVVEDHSMSFHHALHYTWSYLIECGKSMTREEMVKILTLTATDLAGPPRAMGEMRLPPQYSEYDWEDYLMAAIDFPLRVCAWLAQMKANLWVRNGMTLKHQAGTYRGYSLRNVQYQRDIFMLQTAMVICNPSRVLASIIDRYGMEHWMKGIFEQRSDVLDDDQQLELAEDLIHLLVILLSDRLSLLAPEDEPNARVLAMKRDIAQLLLFKPMSFSDMCIKLPDRFAEQDDGQEMLDELTTFKAPDGLSDVGTFQLKQQFIADIDPYFQHYTRNQREESENVYREWMAKKTGKSKDEIVYEPKLRPIPSGIFADLARFTRTGIFAQIVYYALLYPLLAPSCTPNVPETRVESFLQVVLHLILLAVMEDNTEEDQMSEESLESFVYIALTRRARMGLSAEARTIVSLLQEMSSNEPFKASHPKISLVLKRMRQKRPRGFDAAYRQLGLQADRIDTASPATVDASADREKKRKAALERQAKVMAQFQQQQKNFINTQGDIDWGEEEMSDEDEAMDTEEQKKFWKYPAGTCMHCQEEVNDRRPYGTFAFFTESSILRQTPFSDPDFLREVLDSPSSLDRPISKRPFGCAGENRETIKKTKHTGEEVLGERQFIGKGFPPESIRCGPVSTSCGHLMHYKCFMNFLEALDRRHQHQIARHHPEQLNFNEFCCPLCKAQGNAFLPIIWRGKEEVYPGVLQVDVPLEQWLNDGIKSHVIRSEKSTAGSLTTAKRCHDLFSQYTRQNMVSSLESKLEQLRLDAWHNGAPYPVTGPVDLGLDSPSILAPGVQVWNDPSHGMLREIVSIYRRLKDTMYKNGLPTHFVYSREHQRQNDLCASDTLAASLGFSISAVEIYQRGIGSESGSTFLDKVPQSILTHLRILAETAASYTAVGGLRLRGNNRAALEFEKDYETQLFQLFVGHPAMRDLLSPDERRGNVEPLLHQDAFVFLTECALCLSPVAEMPIMHILQLCYLAEIVKAIHVIRETFSQPGGPDWVDYSSAQSSSNFASLCNILTGLHVGFKDRVARSTTTDEEVDIQVRVEYSKAFGGRMATVEQLVKKYALAFLRKCTILLHVKYGVDFSAHISTNPDADELERLTEALKLPSFDEMCGSVGKTDPFAPMPYSAMYEAEIRGHRRTYVAALVKGWMAHAGFAAPITTKVCAESAELTPEAHISLTLSHPTIFELIGLPNNFHTLMNEATKHKCPTMGRMVNDPMICLFCGAIFCGQSACCLKDEEVGPGQPRKQIGGSNQHAKKFHQDVGIFLNIRKCTIFYLYHGSGTWNPAPYLDSHGEHDMGLRSGKPLYFNQKRADLLLRTPWLQHGIPNIISRKLEPEINTGGWDTI